MAKTANGSSLSGDASSAEDDASNVHGAPGSKVIRRADGSFVCTLPRVGGMAAQQAAIEQLLAQMPLDADGRPKRPYRLSFRR